MQRKTESEARSAVDWLKFGLRGVGIPSLNSWAVVPIMAGTVESALAE